MRFHRAMSEVIYIAMSCIITILQQDRSSQISSEAQPDQGKKSLLETDAVNWQRRQWPASIDASRSSKPTCEGMKHDTSPLLTLPTNPWQKTPPPPPCRPSWGVVLSLRRESASCDIVISNCASSRPDRH